MTRPAEVHAAPVADIPLSPQFGWRWRAAFGAALFGVALLVYALATVTAFGVGLWGVNIPFVWGFDLINYGFWIGIANGASLVAAILVLRRNNLRSAVNRFAEGTALAGLVCAGIYPIIHLGRPWLFYWVFPYPATYQVWPQFRSTLTWDFWSISAHAVLTVLFWYTGLIPDLATLRDRARARWQRRFYGVLALGWRGSARQWTYQQAAYRLTAVLVLPLIVVMQSTVSLEHAVMLPPAWHVNSQPIQFIVTGLLSGLAAVLLTAVLLRRLLGLERFITDDNVSLIAKLFASCALLVAYVYLAWAFMFFLDNEDTRKAAVVRIGGDYAWAFWGSLVLMCLAPQVLWLRRVRASAWGAALVAVAANIGAWLDRYSIMIGGLEYDYLPTPANPYGPTVDEWILLAGTAGLFAAIVLLFARMLPVVSLYEARHEERSR